MLPAKAFLPSTVVRWGGDRGLGSIQNNKAQGGNQTEDINIAMIGARGQLAMQRETERVGVSIATMSFPRPVLLSHRECRRKSPFITY